MFRLDLVILRPILTCVLPDTVHTLPGITLNNKVLVLTFIIQYYISKGGPICGTMDVC